MNSPGFKVLRVLPALSLLSLLVITCDTFVLQVAAADEQPLESLHGMVLTAYNVDPAIDLEDLSYLSSEIWAKVDFTRYESISDGDKSIGIQRGAIMYSFVEGRRSGVKIWLRGGIGTTGLIRQIELVKSLGEKVETYVIDGVVEDAYVYKDAATGEIVWTTLCRETSIPHIWMGLLPNQNVTVIVYQNMEANIPIPDSMFEVPEGIDFSGDPFGPATTDDSDQRQ